MKRAFAVDGDIAKAAVESSPYDVLDEIKREAFEAGKRAALDEIAATGASVVTVVYSDLVSDVSHVTSSDILSTMQSVEYSDVSLLSDAIDPEKACNVNEESHVLAPKSLYDRALDLFFKK